MFSDISYHCPGSFLQHWNNPLLANFSLASSSREAGNSTAGLICHDNIAHGRQTDIKVSGDL